MRVVADKALFDTFEEAFKYFNLTGHIIKIIHHPDSLEQILQGGNVVKCIGIGKTTTPGRPAGNQQLHSQNPIFSRTLRPPYLLPIFYKGASIEYMGMYTYKSFKKKMSSSGFYYFEFTFHRESKYYTIVPIENDKD